MLVLTHFKGHTMGGFGGSNKNIGIGCADGRIGKAYGAQTTPHIFIVDPAGQLVYKGGIDSIASASKADIAKADNYVKLAFNDLGAGRKVAHASTKPYGCSIKYAD